MTNLGEVAYSVMFATKISTKLACEIEAMMVVVATRRTYRQHGPFRSKARGRIDCFLARRGADDAVDLPLAVSEQIEAPRFCLRRYDGAHRLLVIIVVVALLVVMVVDIVDFTAGRHAAYIYLTGEDGDSVLIVAIATNVDRITLDRLDRRTRTSVAAEVDDLQSMV